MLRCDCVTVARPHWAFTSSVVQTTTFLRSLTTRAVIVAARVCGGLERERWLHRWKTRLLPCPHHHVVFTIPHELLDLWRYNKRAVANILFAAAASQTLQQLLADPKFCGGQVGLLAGLHTWSQTLAAHVHLHVLVTAGGLDANQALAARS